MIKKSKSFKQSNFIRGFAKISDSKVKVADLGFCEDSHTENQLPEIVEPADTAADEEMKEPEAKKEPVVLPEIDILK